MNDLKRMSLAAFVLALSLVTTACSAADIVSHHENVLGTSLELQVGTTDNALASAVETHALQTIDQLGGILSAYDSSSELCRWQRGELSRPDLSNHLECVLQSAELWRERTDGAFNVRAYVLTKLWETAAAKQRIPTDDERRAAVAQVADPDVDGCRVNLDGLAKGYILDVVCESVRTKFPTVQRFVINVGGDIRRLGDAPVDVSISDPADAGVGAAALISFQMNDSMAVATSGDYRRHLKINGRQYSHIIDPRNGFPQQSVRSATVVGPTAIDADAAATALCVLGPEAGLAMIEALPDFECLMLTANHQMVVSSGFPWATQNQTATASAERKSRETDAAGRLVTPRNYILTVRDEKPKTGLLVDFTLNRPEGRRYRRPYVAVWLEDKDGFPVKTAVLWMQTDQPGPRWHRDLTRWYRNDRLRQVVEDTQLIGTISSATRGPGEYQARFDGTDNDGKRLPSGKYTLCIEAAREHGTYQIIRQTMDLGDQPIKATKLKGNVEVSSASFAFTPWKETEDKDAK